jgi:predicted nucleic acid-binding protein
VAERPLTVVCDAGPLIHLHEIDCLELLEGFSPILVPAEVRREVQRHRPRALTESPGELVFETVELPLGADFRAVVRTFALDRGEQEAIALALDYAGSILLTDDSAARLAAKALGLRVHGTLGILLRSARRGTRTQDQVLVTLRSLPSRSTLHLRSALLQEIIREVRAWSG